MAKTVDFTSLLEKYPPRHPGPHRPKRKVKTNTHVFTVIDRLPCQGITDWKKQDGIPQGKPTEGLWGPSPVRGLAVAGKKKPGKK